MDDTVLKLLVLRELLSQSGSDDSASSARNISLVEPGLKVVRGPDWKWENQDGGEGHVGTVVEIGKSSTVPEKQIIVVWDNGIRGNYRIGYASSYDLRTLDNCSIGVHHPTVTCNSCRKSGVIGMRWKCKVCYDYDLCTRCYMSDRHDITHPFTRYQTNNGNMVDMPKRQGSVKILMRGMFASSKVVRGQDWKWERQDGGSGNSGIVSSLKGWEDNTEWNACNVTWSHNSSSNLYRIGFEGKIDLKCIEDAPDGYYYRDHLPITGDEARVVQEVSTGNTEVKENPGRSFIDLCESLEELYRSGQFCDFTITVKDCEFKTHKSILAARSSVFASMFLHDMQEKITGMVDIPDCEPNIFDDFLFYLYSGKTERLSSSNVVSLFDVAEKYDVQCLKTDCVQFIKINLSVDFICDVLELAIKYTDKELMECAKDFFILNANKIILTSKWQNFVIEHPVAANELFIKAFHYGKDKLNEKLV